MKVHSQPSVVRTSHHTTPSQPILPTAKQERNYALMDRHIHVFCWVAVVRHAAAPLAQPTLRVPLPRNPLPPAGADTSSCPTQAKQSK
jgi:hypothetical protein